MHQAEQVFLCCSEAVAIPPFEDDFYHGSLMGLELIVGINESNSTQQSLVTSLAAKSYRTDQNAKRGKRPILELQTLKLQVFL